MGWQQLFAELSAGRQQLDRQVEEDCTQARQNLIGIFCAKGCSNCCSLTVNCSFTEALAIARKIDTDQQQAIKEKIPLLRQISRQAEELKGFLRQFRDQLGDCPFLASEDGSCSIYPQRPFSCWALISTRNSSWCAVDFASLHPLEKEAFLSSLDPEVVAFPTHYLAAPQATGQELESLALFSMRERFGISLAGSLIYLVWLELEHQLSNIIPQGFAATRSYLETNQLDLPFQLQLQSR